MNDFKIRRATIDDTAFLVETIIEAEKSGTDKLSYSTIFGLSETEVNKYLIKILEEEIDGCELSISSFMVAESNGSVVAALSAWVEGSEGISSTILKGNLLSYIIPKKYMDIARSHSGFIRDLHVDYLPKTIQIGAGYVAKEFRGNRLLGMLNNEIVTGLLIENDDVSSVWAQIFSCNVPSFKTYIKAGYTVVTTKESTNIEIESYLPSNKKYVLTKNYK